MYHRIDVALCSKLCLARHTAMKNNFIRVLVDLLKVFFVIGTSFHSRG